MLQSARTPFWIPPPFLDYEVTSILGWLLEWCLKGKIQSSGLVLMASSRDGTWEQHRLRNISQSWGYIPWWPCASHCGVGLVPSTCLTGSVWIGWGPNGWIPLSSLSCGGVDTTTPSLSHVGYIESAASLPLNFWACCARTKVRTFFSVCL